MKIQGHLVMCLMIEFARPQFTSSRRLTKTPCEFHGAALVEQFFNVIFAEFQHSPPACTCVQMCADQATYCYPTGCFKKEKKKESSPVSKIQQDTKTVFLVDNDRDVLADLMGNMNLISSPAGLAESSYQRQRDHNLMGRANPFREIVFKYKRLPKLQMKYNLREQIKHARDKKAEVDLSKTRWPTNKQINKQTNQRTSNYLTSMFPESNQQETPKYFKRYLTKRENQIGSDISALYLYKDASNFSVETLIDNLIERGLEDVYNTSRFKLSNLSKVKDEGDIGDSKIINSVVEDFQNNTNEITLKISLATNINNDTKGRNNSDTNSSTAAYFEMITTLSNQIEKQNNLSLEVISNLTGNTFHDVSYPKSVNISTSTNNKTSDSFKTLKVSDEITKSTTNRAPTSLHFIPVINNQVKKSKQRIVRKLRNRKLN